MSFASHTQIILPVLVSLTRQKWVSSSCQVSDLFPSLQFLKISSQSIIFPCGVLVPFCCRQWFPCPKFHLIPLLPFHTGPISLSYFAFLLHSIVLITSHTLTGVLFMLSFMNPFLVSWDLAKLLSPGHVY